MAHDPAREIAFQIGPYKALFFDLRALRKANVAFRGRALVDVLRTLGEDEVMHLSAFGYLHEGKPCSDEIMEQLIEAEPDRLLPLIAHVKLAVLTGYAHYTSKEQDKAVGEVMAALKLAQDAAARLAGPTSPPSSAPADGGASPSTKPGA